MVDTSSWEYTVTWKSIYASHLRPSIIGMSHSIRLHNLSYFIFECLALVFAVFMLIIKCLHLCPHLNSVHMALRHSIIQIEGIIPSIIFCYSSFKLNKETIEASRVLALLSQPSCRLFPLIRSKSRPVRSVKIYSNDYNVLL